jgi:hypothetical protein
VHWAEEEEEEILISRSRSTALQATRPHTSQGERGEPWAKATKPRRLVRRKKFSFKNPKAPGLSDFLQKKKLTEM